MRKKILALCLMTSLLANTGYGVADKLIKVKSMVSCAGFSCSQRTASITGFSIFIGSVLAGVGLIIAGVHPYAGDAWEVRKPCGTGQGLCIDACKYGILNTQNDTCETIGVASEPSCLLTVDNYTLVNSVWNCPNNACEGGSACVEQGQAIVPANLYAPVPKKTWGIPVFALGLGTVAAGAITFMIFLFCLPTKN